MTKFEQLLHFKNLLESQEYIDDDILHLKNGLIRELGYLIEAQEKLYKPRKLVWTKTQEATNKQCETYTAEDKDTNLFFEITVDDGIWWLFADKKNNQNKETCECNSGCWSLDDAQWVAEKILGQIK